MATKLNRARTDVAAAAARVDRTLTALGDEGRGLKRSVRTVSPATLLGGALVAGFLFVIVPRRLRGTALVGVGQFVFGRVMNALRAGRDA